MRTLALAGVCLLAVSPALADSVDQLSARGEQLAKEGRLTEAIDAFKQADRLEQKAKHACLIALAYTRRELWPQAEIFLAECHDRASPSDPLPDWVPLADKQLAERLRNAKVAAVEIRVEPASVKARITVSSFAPDEAFEPRTIHLNQGRHLITATAEGREAVTETVEVSTTGAREVVLKFVPKARPKPVDKEIEPAPPIEKPVAKQPSRVLPWTLIGSGVALGMVGGLYHLLVYKPAHDKLVEASNAMDQAAYDRYEPEWNRKLKTNIAIYAGAGVLVATGVVLRMTVYRSRPESAVKVSAQPTSGGAIVGLEWRR